MLAIRSSKENSPIGMLVMKEARINGPQEPSQDRDLLATAKTPDYWRYQPKQIANQKAKPEPAKSISDLSKHCIRSPILTQDTQMSDSRSQNLYLVCLFDISHRFHRLKKGIIYLDNIATNRSPILYHPDWAMVSSARI